MCSYVCPFGKVNEVVNLGHTLRATGFCCGTSTKRGGRASRATTHKLQGGGGQQCSIQVGYYLNRIPDLILKFSGTEMHFATPYLQPI
jgi:hypothetical protein